MNIGRFRGQCRASEASVETFVERDLYWGKVLIFGQWLGGWVVLSASPSIVLGTQNLCLKATWICRVCQES